MWYYFLDNPTQQKPALPTACPNCSLAYSLGAVREEGSGQRQPAAAKNSSALAGDAQEIEKFLDPSPPPTDIEVLGTPVCNRHSSDFFYPLQTYTLIFPEWFYFPWNVLSTIPIQNTMPAISLFNITTGRDRLVFTEQEISPQEHPWASKCLGSLLAGYILWPKHLPQEC